LASAIGAFALPVLIARRVPKADTVTINVRLLGKDHAVSGTLVGHGESQIVGFLEKDLVRPGSLVISPPAAANGEPLKQPSSATSPTQSNTHDEGRHV
jgi:hypothetical protein